MDSVQVSKDKEYDGLHQQVIKILEEFKLQQKILDDDQKDNEMRIVQLEYNESQNNKRIKSLELKIEEMESKENETNDKMEKLAVELRQKCDLIMSHEKLYQNRKKVCNVLVSYK